jgi:Transposase
VGNGMRWVGIDLHRSRSQIAVLDDRGRELLSRRIINDPEAFLELLGEIDGESRIALEATHGWEWLADRLEAAGYELPLAHPLRTKAIASARVKNDAVDARPPAAHRAAARGLHRAAPAARAARPTAPPRRAHADALGAQGRGPGDPGQAGREASLQRHVRPVGCAFPSRSSSPRALAGASTAGSL